MDMTVFPQLALSSSDVLSSSMYYHRQLLRGDDTCPSTARVIFLSNSKWSELTLLALLLSPDPYSANTSSPSIYFGLTFDTN